ncbi:MAG: outer membrane lipoprotein carrier protein LolA [Nitrospirae bacterium]|nr:MAG: outer membrane lipoprotein carrier protein LolA [Nitrospirota bacterium]
MRRSFLSRLQVVLVCAVFILMPAAYAAAADADAMISRIQKAYEDIRDIRGSFSQKSIIRDLNKTETYKGDFSIKPPHKMKWSYKGRSAQDFIINNGSVLIIKKAENQAYKGRFDKTTYGQTPVALLGGFGNIRDEFTTAAKGDAVLILKPKKPFGTVASISIAVAGEGFPIRSFVITDTHANVIEIELKNIMLNTGLKDELFDPQLPKGISIFDQGL